MSLKTKILSFIMAVGIAFSFSSCADTTYAHIINGDKVPSGVYLGYLVQAYMEGSQKVTDTAADPYTQQIDGVDFKQWVKNRAYEITTKNAAISILFKENGCEFTDTDKATIDSYNNAMWSYYGALYEENGTSKASLRKISEIDYMYNILFKKLYDTGGSKEVAEDTIKTYYADNNILVKQIAFSFLKPDGTQRTEAELAELKATAEKYMARANKGEDMDKLIKEYNDAVAAESSSESSSSASSASSAESSSAQGSSSESSAVSSSESSSATSSNEEVNPNFVLIDKNNTTSLSTDTIALYQALKAGKTEIVTITDTSYNVVMRYDILAEKEVYNKNRFSMLYAMKKTDFEQIITDKTATLDVVTNERSIKRYDPEKIVVPEQ